MASVNTAGSRGSAPYTAVVDFITNFVTASAFWHAASSCMAPMTFISFIAERPPTRVGVVTTFRWTTVSTSVVWSTLTTSGLRMSARTYSVRSRSTSGSSRSTPTRYSTSGSFSRRWASFPPRNREIPVMRMRWATFLSLPDGRLHGARPLVAQDRHAERVPVCPVVPGLLAEPALLHEPCLPVGPDGASVVGQDFQADLAHVHVPERVRHDRPNGVLSVSPRPIVLAESDPEVAHARVVVDPVEAADPDELPVHLDGEPGAIGPGRGRVPLELGFHFRPGSRHRRTAVGPRPHLEGIDQLPQPGGVLLLDRPQGDPFALQHPSLPHGLYRSVRSRGRAGPRRRPRAPARMRRCRGSPRARGSPPSRRPGPPDPAPGRRTSGCKARRGSARRWTLEGPEPPRGPRPPGRLRWPPAGRCRTGPPRGRRTAARRRSRPATGSTAGPGRRPARRGRAHRGAGRSPRARRPARTRRGRGRWATPGGAGRVPR